MAERPSQALTKNQQLVLDVLQESNTPLSAYAILDQLRGEGFRAPPQVYRAIEKLNALGQVHRIESMNAFVACSHPACGGLHEAVIFMICENCSDVAEIADAGLAGFLDKLSARQSFEAKRSVVELRGRCSRC